MACLVDVGWSRRHMVAFKVPPIQGLGGGTWAAKSGSSDANSRRYIPACDWMRDGQTLPHAHCSLAGGLRGRFLRLNRSIAGRWEKHGLIDPGEWLVELILIFTSCISRGCQMTDAYHHNDIFRRCWIISSCVIRQFNKWSEWCIWKKKKKKVNTKP